MAEDNKEEFYAAEEQVIDEDETSDEIKEEMEHGDKDEDVYSREGREQLEDDAEIEPWEGREQLEDDAEIEPWEEGFMEGASAAGQLGKDALTGEPLMDVEDVVEAEIDGKIYRFVSKENAEKFREKKKQEEE